MIIPIYHHRRTVRSYREWDDAEPQPATRPASCWYSWTPVADEVRELRGDLLHTTIEGGERPSYLVAAMGASWLLNKGKWFVRTPHDKALDVETVKFLAAQRCRGLYLLPADDPVWADPSRWAVPGEGEAGSPEPAASEMPTEAVAPAAKPEVTPEPTPVPPAGPASQPVFDFGDPDWLKDARKPGRRKAVRS